MTKKIATVILIFAIVGLSVALLIRRDSRVTSNNTPPQNQVDGMTNDSRPQRQNGAGAQSNLINAELPQGSNLQARLEEFARQRGFPLETLSNQALLEFSNAMSQELNRPLDFYGKVVDEDGRPLSAASTTIICLIFPEKQFVTNISTDANGIFQFHGTNGQALNVSIAKGGYEEVPGTNQNHYIFSGVVKTFQYDPNNPVVFHFRKKAL
jgi:hypothetical protein